MRRSIVDEMMEAQSEVLANMALKPHYRIMHGIRKLTETDGPVVILGRDGEQKYYRVMENGEPTEPKIPLDSQQAANYLFVEAGETNGIRRWLVEIGVMKPRYVKLVKRGVGVSRPVFDISNFPPPPIPPIRA